MEHSTLHALELTGQVIALGGIIFFLGLLDPACRKRGFSTHDEFVLGFQRTAVKWVSRGACLAALATFLDLFVEVGEVRGLTVFSGINLPLTWTFATETNVGRLASSRIVVLVAAALAVRLPRIGWWITAFCTFCSIALTSLVSHAAAQPHEQIAVLTSQILHITAAALWVGVLIHLLAARRLIESADSRDRVGLISEIVRRFSPVALTVTTLLAVSGIYMLCRFLGDFGGIFASAYGLTLIIKLSFLAPAIYAGALNYRRIRPQLAAASAPNPTTPAPPVLKRFGSLLELEVTSGILVLVVAGILASVSPPGPAGYYRLTAEQQHMVLVPRIPSASIVNPEKFYGAEVRDLDDFHYSEFTHHWSGVMVGLLGLAWFLQTRGGNFGKWAGYGWPFLLVPFAAFVAVASDPEVWFLHKIPFSQALADPQLSEHQLGAGIILLLVWLGWRDKRTSQARRPLGYALPVIFILGGAMLLGHAHSTLTVTDEVTNLINVQHAIFGAFILTAGVIRWFQLRGLLSARLANFLWPCCIIGLGIYMAFFYRELLT